MNHADKLQVLNDPDPWYQDGLRFECTGCGNCCTGSPGYTWVSLTEIETIADHLKLSIEAFANKYLRQVGQRYSLTERPGNFDCVFLRDQKCTIYAVRPKQCRTFPWWAQNLKDKKAWQEAARHCEGIQNKAPVIAFEKIQEQLHIQESE